MQRMHATHFGQAALVGGLALVLAGGVAVAAPATSAELRPARIALDQSAELRVAAQPGAAPALPQVDGLHFQRTGESSEMSDINGTVSRRNWVLYRVVADHPGKFSIPVGADTLSLEVGSAAAGGASVPTARGTLPSPGASSSTQSATAQGALAWLRVGLPTKKVFVGQAVPVTFKAYFRGGTEVTLSGPPNLGVPAFTISHLDDNPRQSVESLGGASYRVATWTGQAVAAMPGRFTVRATLPIVVRYRAASEHPAADPFAGMLDNDQDPFSASPADLMRSFMKHSAFGGDLADLFGRVREREMNLRAPDQGIDVKPLPAAGQPAGYQGAVGRFEVRSRLGPNAGTTFTPLTLTIEVSGRGNFDRVAMAGLASSPEWKSYPPSAKLTGPETKVFEQAVVPLRSGHLVLPALPFSFFDPEQKQYVTRSSAPIGVDIAPAAAGSVPPAMAATVPAPAHEPAASWRPNRVEAGRFVASLQPPYRRPWFWPAVSLPWLALAAVGVRPRIRLSARRARLRAANNMVDQHRLAMKSAVAAQDALHFYEAAAAGLRIRLAQRWQLTPDEVTAAEAAARLDGAEDSIIGVLSVAERLRYGAAVVEPASLAELQASVERELDRLEVRS